MRIRDLCAAGVAGSFFGVVLTWSIGAPPLLIGAIGSLPLLGAVIGTVFRPAWEPEACSTEDPPSRPRETSSSREDSIGDDVETAPQRASSRSERKERRSRPVALPPESAHPQWAGVNWPVLERHYSPESIRRLKRVAAAALPFKAAGRFASVPGGTTCPLFELKYLSKDAKRATYAWGDASTAARAQPVRASLEILLTHRRQDPATREIAEALVDAFLVDPVVAARTSINLVGTLMCLGGADSTDSAAPDPKATVCPVVAQMSAWAAAVLDAPVGAAPAHPMHPAPVPQGSQSGSAGLLEPPAVEIRSAAVATDRPMQDRVVACPPGPQGALSAPPTDGSPPRGAHDGVVLEPIRRIAV